jgi:hypothetical protein
MLDVCNVNDNDRDFFHMERIQSTYVLRRMESTTRKVCNVSYSLLNRNREEEARLGCGSQSIYNRKYGWHTVL